MKKYNFILINLLSIFGTMVAISCSLEESILPTDQRTMVVQYDSITCIKIGKPSAEIVIIRSLKNITCNGKEYKTFQLPHCRQPILPISEMTYETFFNIVNGSRYLVLSTENRTPQKSPAQESEQCLSDADSFIDENYSFY